jgi:hypothetical protein
MSNIYTHPDVVAPVKYDETVTHGLSEYQGQVIIDIFELMYTIWGNAHIPDHVKDLSQSLDTLREAFPELRLGEPETDEIDPFNSDAEADADVLRSAGWGTDEDYGGTDERF